MANFFPINYNDTVSIKTYEVIDKKALLNAWYGTEVNIMTKRDFIVVNVDDKPTMIFKNNIIAVTKNGNRAEIVCVGDVTFYTKNDYVDVAKRLID